MTVPPDETKQNVRPPSTQPTQNATPNPAASNPTIQNPQTSNSMSGEPASQTNASSKANPNANPAAQGGLEPTSPQATDQNHQHRNRSLLWFTLVILVAGLIWFLLWFFYFSDYETTDDAYANGNMININSAISGSVIGFFADDTDLVTEGQLLVQLDPTEYQVVYDKALANLAALTLQVRQSFDNVHASQANVESKKVVYNRTKYDYDNRSHLVASKAVSNEDYTHARDSFAVAELELKQAEAQLEVALDAIGNNELEHHPLIEEQKNVVRQAFYNLRHCTVYAPATGYVAKRSVDVGEWVTPNSAMMAVIPTDYVWVDANYKETQLQKMRIGQPTKVWFDMYGSNVEFDGTVLGIASGSGSVFSLIPPQNATGNWIKIVQRLAVRIALDPEQVKKYPIRLGISAYVSTEIVNQNLPMLAQAPASKPIGTTNVFEINMAEVNQIIEEVISANQKPTSLRD